MARHINRAHVYSSARLYLRVVSIDDAQRMLNTRPAQARRLSGPKDRQLIIQLIERNSHLEHTELRPLEAFGALNVTDVFANAMGRAGILERRPGKKLWDDNSGRRQHCIGNRVDQAMTKVEMWPLVGDTKAIRVGPRIGPTRVCTAIEAYSLLGEMRRLCEGLTAAERTEIRTVLSEVGNRTV
jgi:hypothetical protein